LEIPYWTLDIFRGCLRAAFFVGFFVEKKRFLQILDVFCCDRMVGKDDSAIFFSK